MGAAPKLKLVVSDFHLGKGPYRDDGSVNVFEDFRQDQKFAQFLDYHSDGEWRHGEIELIVNGDFFNLLSVDLDGRMQEAITERVSVEKTEAILRGHPAVFDALARFADGPGRSVTFIMGNHDPGLLFGGVREAISRRVGGAHRFILDSYDFDGVHVEHGMQREPMNAFNPSRYFAERDGEVCLNLPLGSRYIIHVLNEEKAQRPYIDKVAPFASYYRWAIFNDPEAVLRISARSIAFVAAAALKRLPHLDPMPVADLVRRFLRYTAFPTLEHEARHLLAHRRFHTVIMGHTHVPLYREYGRDRVYVNTGTWNPMTLLDMGSLGRTEQLTYAHVEYVDGRPRTRLREWRGLSRPAEDVFF
jgi:UDP-2,3-diacylglucosamine pyrophosphatase LpxH